MFRHCFHSAVVTKKEKDIDISVTAVLYCIPCRNILLKHARLSVSSCSSTTKKFKFKRLYSTSFYRSDISHFRWSGFVYYRLCLRVSILLIHRGFFSFIIWYIIYLPVNYLWDFNMIADRNSHCLSPWHQLCAMLFCCRTVSMCSSTVLHKMKSKQTH